MKTKSVQWIIEAVGAAYKAGYDCGLNGANTENCHFTIFSTPETARAWEEGKRDAERVVEAKLEVES